MFKNVYKRLRHMDLLHLLMLLMHSLEQVIELL